MLRLFMLVLVAQCVIIHETSAHPLKRQMVDLSYPYEENMFENPRFGKFDKCIVKNGEEEGFWVYYEDISTGTHQGTHIDAQSHAIKEGFHVDQLDINNFISPASVIDIRERAEADPDAKVVKEDFINFERSTGRSINGTVVIIWSGWGEKWYNQAAYLGLKDDSMMPHFPTLSPAAAQWLVDKRSIKGIAMDTISVDDATTFQSHTTLLKEGIFVIENLANIDKIPPYGATLYIMPLKIKGASGAPTRIVATFNKNNGARWPEWNLNFWDNSKILSSWPTLFH